MIEIKGCIFDLDGVIVDTAKYHYQAWNEIAKSLGFNFSLEENEQLKGISRKDSLDVILKIGNVFIDQSRKEELLVRKNDIYLNLISDMNESEILPGVKLFLEELRKRKIKIGLGSASKNARGILKQIGIMDCFDSIVDGNGVLKSKPHPEVFLNGAKELNLLPNNVVVFEDSSKGLDAAKTGGFLSVGIGSDDHLGHADMVIPGFEGFTFDGLLSTLRESVSEII